MKITSNASWTKIDDSNDTHDNIEAAVVVCRMLREDFSTIPCDIRGYCTDSWVEIDGVRQK